MEPSHEIVLGCCAPDPDTAEICIDWFVTQYAADNDLEYFYVESISRLPAAFGNFINHHQEQEKQNVLDSISDEIYAAATSGNPILSDELSKVYLLMNDNQFDHRTAIYFCIDGDDLAIHSAEDRDLFYVRVVVFQ